jgi:hypothetical protein
MAIVLTLKSIENNVATCDFVVIGIPDAKYSSLSDANLFKEYIIDNLKKNYTKEYDTYGVIFVGNLLKFNMYPTLIDKLPKRAVGGSVQYRDYTKTLEAQMNSKSSINVAEDTSTSWNTVRTALGARNIRTDCYGVVLEVIKNK